MLRRLSHDYVFLKTLFFWHIALNDLNSFPPLSAERAVIPSSRSTDHLPLVQLAHYWCLSCHLKPNTSRQMAACIRQVVAGSVQSFFHGAVNVFVNAVPLLDDGYARAQ